MFAFDPSRRITMQQAMEHPFFDEVKTKPYFAHYLTRSTEAQNNAAPTGIEHIDDDPNHVYHNVSIMMFIAIVFISDCVIGAF